MRLYPLDDIGISVQSYGIFLLHCNEHGTHLCFIDKNENQNLKCLLNWKAF